MMNYYEHSKIIRVSKFYDRIVQKRVSETRIFFIFLFTVDSLLLSDLGNNGESFYLIVNLGVGRCLVLFWFFFTSFLIRYWFPCQCILENFQLEKITKRLHYWTSRLQVYILLYVTHLYIESGTCVIMHGCRRTSFSDEHKKHKESCRYTYRRTSGLKLLFHFVMCF